jgi:exonuclease III
MTDKLSVGIYSMNVRGLRDQVKRTQVFSWLHNRNANIYLLQETHSTSDTEKLWKDDWGNNNIYFSHGTSNSRGVSVLFENSGNFEIKRDFHDEEGRFIILDIILNNQKITLVNVYGPNLDNPAFFENIHSKLNDFDCESLIWGGDFNCVQDVRWDKKGGRAHTHINSQKRIHDIMGDYDLIDIWRRKNPNVYRYTWHSNTTPLFNVVWIISWSPLIFCLKLMIVILHLVSKQITLL